MTKKQPLKECSTCGKTKPATKEYFYVDERKKDGLYSLCKPCHADAKKRWTKRNRDKVLEIKRNWYYTATGRLNKIRGSAKARGKYFDLDLQYYKDNCWDKPCHYCGANTENGVDRKNNDLGYINENVVPSCASCNASKGTMSYEDFTKKVSGEK